jgi:hypothetical protein
MRRLLPLLLLSLLLLPVHAAWQRTPAAGMTLYVPAGKARLAARLTTMIVRDLPRLTKAVGVAKADNFAIYAYTDLRAFHRDTQADPFTLGLSYAPGGTIRLDATQAPADLRETLAHELTHSLIAQRLGNNDGALPDWVNEGIAGQLSEPVSRTALPQVSRLIHRDGVLGLDELEDAFPRGRFRDAAYLQSRSMTAWLEYRYPGIIAALLGCIADGASFDGALLTCTGLTANDWVDSWVQSVPEYLFWLNLASSPVIYAPVAILLVIIVTIRTIRRKKREAEEEEATPPTHAPKTRLRFRDDLDDYLEDGN